MSETQTDSISTETPCTVSSPPAWSCERLPPDVQFYILLAEFDIDIGTQLKHAIPHCPPNNKPEAIADMMMPDGAEKQQYDSIVFFLNREEVEESHLMGLPGQSVQNFSLLDSNPFLYCTSIVRCKKDETVRRGAVFFSVGIAAPFPFIQSLKPWLHHTLDAYFDTRNESTIVELYNRIASSGIASAVKSYARLKQWGVAFDNTPLELFLKDPFAPSSVSSFIPIRINCCEDVMEEASLSLLLNKFGINGLLMLYNAILLEKKVLILGHSLPVSLLCRHVISCCLFLCPEMQGVLKRRVYPYVSLNDTNFLSNEAFIVGTVNPFFEEKSEWWVLCDINTGIVKYADTNPNNALSVFKNLYKTIEQLLLLKCNPLETYLRQLFQFHTREILECTLNLQNDHENIYRRKKEITNLVQVEALKQTKTYQMYTIRELTAGIVTHKNSKTRGLPDIPTLTRKLSFLKNHSSEDNKRKVNDILLLFADRLSQNETRWDELHYHISRYHLDMEQLLQAIENEANKLKITALWQCVKSKKHALLYDLS